LNYHVDFWRAKHKKTPTSNNSQLNPQKTAPKTLGYWFAVPGLVIM